MWMYNSILTAFLLVFLPVFAFPQQNCSLKLSGFIADSGTDMPLEVASIYISETGTGAITDSSGFFQINDLCAGDYHIVVSHIGCESQQVFVQLKSDTLLRLEMEHSINVLQGITITDSSIPNSTQNTQTINEQTILDNASANLSNMLETISGVSTLKNGTGISKPIVHGLYGNRLTILNNGVVQSGQQWGNDHSPEIDPLVANKVKLIKGVSALSYMGSNLGSVIIVEPKSIEKEPHLHGKASYFFESNGLGNGLNVQLQQYAPRMAWKINGTLKKSGDKKTADYYLNNTGGQEANVALQLEKAFSDRFSVDLYFSTFNAQLGILRGSHIGNLTDLETAFVRDKPFYTETTFSYALDVPKQHVNHHLLKLHSKYFVGNTQWLDFTIAGQLNNRREFDVRRSGRSNIPALSLQQLSYFFEGKYHREFKKDLKIKSGVQFNLTDNTNNPETGILPLIPDYLSYESGIYWLIAKRVEKMHFELGLRYDNVLQNVASITQATPREIVRFKNVFHNVSGSGGCTYVVNENLKLSGNIGYATRNPAINELYSGGLHQGVSGIEEGNADLKTEKSIKATLGLTGKIADKFSFESLFYYQKIGDYIFLNPQDEVRLTIRGLFRFLNMSKPTPEFMDSIFRLNFNLANPLIPKFHTVTLGEMI